MLARRAKTYSSFGSVVCKRGQWRLLTGRF